MAEVKEAVKTSNSPSSAYIDTVEGELRSKSKRLALQKATAIKCDDVSDFSYL